MVFLWFTASLIYTGYMVINEFPLDLRYFPLQSASLPFSVGAMIYHFRENLQIIPIKAVFLAIILSIINAFFAKIIWNNYALEGFYVALFLNAFIVACLGRVNKFEIAPWLRRIDKFLGKLSYPIFLIHWNIALLVINFVPLDIKPHTNILFFFSLPPLFFVSYLINIYIEGYANRIRNKIRPRKIGPSSSPYTPS